MRKHLLSCLLFCSAFNLASQNVCVDVDLSTSKKYGNTTSLEREKFFNLHNSISKEFNSEELDYLKKVKMGIGRIFMFPNIGSSAATGITDKEIANRGKNWYKFFKTNPDFSNDAIKEVILTAHPTPGNAKIPSKNYCFHWKGVNADYTSEIKVLNSFFQHYFVDNGLSLPKYIEPMNEPYVHAGDYKRYGASEVDVRSEMARLHKAIAQDVHKNFPTVMVGGYASAWPYVEGFHSDFEHWKSRMKMFIDTVGKDLDFVSFHIYDGMNVAGGDCFRSGSNMEGIMDLVEGYCSIKFGKPIPLLISEHGMTRKDWSEQPYSEERDWKFLRSINHQTIQFMERPGNILKCIPFISGKASWNKSPNPYPWVISRKDENGNWTWTHLIKYFEFWKDIKGQYVDTQSSEIDVLTAAFVDGNTAYVVLNNLEDDKTIDLNLFNNDKNKIKKISIRRLYSKNGKPVLEESKINKDKKPTILLRYDETVIATVEYAKKISIKNELENKKFYATEYLKPVQANVENSFVVNTNSGKMKRALLQLGVARPHGMKVLPTRILINGKNYKIPSDWKGYDQSDRTKEGFFGVLDVPVMVNDLQDKNDISVMYNDNGGTISTVALNIDYIN